MLNIFFFKSSAFVNLYTGQWNGNKKENIKKKI